MLGVGIALFLNSVFQYTAFINLPIMKSIIPSIDEIIKPLNSISPYIKSNVTFLLYPLFSKVSIKHSSNTKFISKIDHLVLKSLQIFLFISLFNPLFSTYGQTISDGTTIVVVRTHYSIIMGADSKERQTTKRPGLIHHWNIPSPERTIEKIRIADNMAFAIAGFYKRFSNNERQIYDVFQIAELSCSGDYNIFEKAGTFKQKVQSPLEAAWKDILLYDYSADLNDNPVIFIACGFYDNVPFVIIQRFLPQNANILKIDFRNRLALLNYAPKTEIQTTRYPYSNAFDSTIVEIVSDAINKNSLSSIDSLIETNPIEYVRRAVEMAIAIDGDKNGPPIRILCINQSGMTWITEDK